MLRGKVEISDIRRNIDRLVCIAFDFGSYYVLYVLYVLYVCTVCGFFHPILMFLQIVSWKMCVCVGVCVGGGGSNVRM